MKNRITITVGISGSGKSTWAHEQWKKDPLNVVIVNRDKIRELLFGYTEETISQYYNREDIFSLEKRVTRYEDTLINEALESGKDVIVDATHLKRAYIERFKYWNVPTEYKMFPIELKEAEIRDMSRKRFVGVEVIRKQYNRYVGLFHELQKNPLDLSPVSIEQDKTKPPCIIFDIDGTLAHMKGRSPYDWAKVGTDTADESTKHILKEIYSNVSSDTKIIICTGRDGIALYETEKWLKEWEISYDEIYIREKKDSRPDWVIKEEMWRKITEENYIVGMFDDRLQVVRRARSLGLKVFNVEYNNF